MKNKICKILRGTIASLLFLTITLVVIIQFGFTLLHYNVVNLTKPVDAQRLLNEIEEVSTDQTTEEISLKYIDDYANYVFHKNSFPSLQTVDYSKVSESELKAAQETVRNISEKINLPYEEVVLFRNVHNVVANRSIYLLINIGLFFLLLILFIILRDFKKTANLFGGSLLLAISLIFLAKNVLLNKIKSHLSEAAVLLSKSIIEGIAEKTLTQFSLIYLAIGIVITASAILYEHYLNRFPQKRN